jgi:predicted dehydrogenase
MRRDADKAKDYAARHGVPKWYSNADDLINDTEINAIYIATPPAFHEEYAIAAINAGKFNLCKPILGQDSLTHDPIRLINPKTYKF